MRQVSVHEGLRLSGIKKGHLSYEPGRVLIRVGFVKFRRYSIRQLSDGRIVCRRGRLVRATVMQEHDIRPVVVFDVDAAA